jgi:AbrB family looped-hinge helix DNA binding protein
MEVVFMTSVDITSMSSRGQVVIPLNLRELMGLKDGEKFAITGREDTIVLKKIQMPSFSNFDKLMQQTQEFAKKRGLKQKDLDEAVQRARK